MQGAVLKRFENKYSENERMRNSDFIAGTLKKDYEQFLPLSGSMTNLGVYRLDIRNRNNSTKKAFGEMVVNRYNNKYQN